MKKLIILFLGLAIISCGGSDDDESMGRTTDPLIGVWLNTVEEITTTFTANSNGNFTSLTEYPTSSISSSGTWSNNGSDLNSNSQLYTFTTEENNDSENDDPQILRVVYSNNFNAFTIYSGTNDEVTYTRQ